VQKKVVLNVPHNLTPIAADAAGERVRRLAEQVDEATEAVVEVARQDPNRVWTARELRDAARNGWAPAAVMIAINRLVAQGKLKRDGRRRLRYLA
jgi:hypothetical protein